MNVRVEMRFAQSWDQPVMVVHPDEELARAIAIEIVNALNNRFGRPTRATVGDNPPESGKWAEGEVVYSRGC